MCDLIQRNTEYMLVPWRPCPQRGIEAMQPPPPLVPGLQVSACGVAKNLRIFFEGPPAGGPPVAATPPPSVTVGQSSAKMPTPRCLAQGRRRVDVLQEVGRGEAGAMCLSGERPSRLFQQKKRWIWLTKPSSRPSVFECNLCVCDGLACKTGNPRPRKRHQ